MSEINWNSFKVYGPTVGPALYNNLVDAVQSLALEPGKGYSLTRTPVGTILRIKAGNSTSATPEPFAVSFVPVSGDDTITVSVRPGTVNQLVPSNMFDTATIDASGTFYAKLSLASDGQNLTSVSVAVDDTAPVGQSATANALPASLDILLAIVKDSKVYQTQAGSLMVIGTESFSVDASSPVEPGMPTTTPYFIWNISEV